MLRLKEHYRYNLKLTQSLVLRSISSVLPLRITHEIPGLLVSIEREKKRIERVTKKTFYSVFNWNVDENGMFRKRTMEWN